MLPWTVFSYVAVLGSGAAAPAPVPMRRPVSSDTPMIMLPWTRSGPEALRKVSPAVRPHVVLQHRLMVRPERRAALFADFEACRRAGTLLALHVRTHWPVDDPDMAAREGRIAPADLVEEVLARFPNVVALIDAEQYAFTREQREYAARLLDLCDRAGVWFILDAGWHTGSDWREVFLDPTLKAAVERHGRVFLPMWEMNVADAMYYEQSQLLGMWLSGVVAAWGANPQRWYWGEAGFAEIGENAGWRFGKRGGMKEAVRYLDRYPFYAHSLVLTALTGARAFWIGGEIAPNAWNADGSPSRYWKESLEPAFTFLLRQRLIPDARDLAREVKFWIQDDAGLPHLYSAECARTGRRSLRIAAGAGRGVHLAWTNDDFAPLRPAGKYEAGAYIRTVGFEGKAYLDLTWLEAGRWKHCRSDAVSGTSDWTHCTLRAGVGGEARFAMLHLRVDGERGDAWFDDVYLVRDGAGVNLLPNPGFETARAPGASRPLGWRPASVYGSPDLHRCARGVNRVWHATYGLFHPAEFLPNTSQLFPAAWLPPGHTRPETVDPSAPVIDTAALDGVHVPPEWARIGPKPGRPLVWATARFLWIANSSENTSGVQSFDVEWDGLRLRGRLPLHHFLLLVRDVASRARRLVAYSPRPERTEFVVECAGKDGAAPACTGCGDDAVVGRAPGRGLHVVVDHSRKRWIEFEITGGH